MQSSGQSRSSQGAVQDRGAARNPRSVGWEQGHVLGDRLGPSPDSVTTQNPASAGRTSRRGARWCPVFTRTPLCYGEERVLGWDTAPRRLHKALARDPVALGSPRLNSPTSTVSKLSSASYDSHFPSQISTSSDLFDPTLLGRDRDLLISLLQVQPPPPIVQYPE